MNRAYCHRRQIAVRCLCRRVLRLSEGARRLAAQPRAPGSWCSRSSKGVLQTLSVPRFESGLSKTRQLLLQPSVQWARKAWARIGPADLTGLARLCNTCSEKHLPPRTDAARSPRSAAARLSTNGRSQVPWEPRRLGAKRRSQRGAWRSCQSPRWR